MAEYKVYLTYLDHEVEIGGDQEAVTVVLGAAAADVEIKQLELI